MNTNHELMPNRSFRKSTGNLVDKVLFVIDDDETILDLICTHLEIYGFRPENLHKFSSAGDALDIIRFVRPNLIISDIHMPGISGDSLAKLIQWPEFEKSPVIAITGDSDFHIEGNTTSFLDAVVYKPIDSVDLIRKVVETLGSAEKNELDAATDRRHKLAKKQRSIQNKEHGLRHAFGKS